MSRYRRWNQLLELLAADGQLQVEQAARRARRIAATIRRDFDDLAGQQMLARIRGGAVAQGVTYDLPLRYQVRAASVGEAADRARWQPDWSSQARWPASTAARPPPRSRGRWRSGPTLSTAAAVPALTVVTNALNIATELAVRQNIKIVVTGGVARPQSYELTGPLATGVLERVSSMWRSSASMPSTPPSAPWLSTRARPALTS